MGINGLLGFLRPITKDSSIQVYTGKSLGIDTSCYLYKGAYSCATELALGIPTNKYIDYLIQVIRLLQASDIKPVAVFDGNKLPAKSNVNRSRESTRKDTLRKGKALWYSNDKTAAAGFFQKALKVTWNMVLTTIE
ncbi:PIN domain, partial [Paramuricea clavata]